MKIEAWYSLNFESRLKGRFITLEHLTPLLKEYENDFTILSLGVSELGKNIPLLKVGSGKKNILAWSQMHGNETTTTKSIFDFLKFLTEKELFQDEIKGFLENYTLYVIPVLNPDGASLYTRENANNIDLNRDAQDLSQKESKILQSLFKDINPQLCLNLHDQRSIFGLKSKMPAVVSFLSPAANKERTTTSSRKEAMRHIVKMNKTLQRFIPNQIGRYDDSFNDACVGDAFQMEGVPTILFEAGHTGNDYMRVKTRAYIFYSFLALFDIIGKNDTKINYEDYFLIPENIKNYKDFILRNVLLHKGEELTSISIQYTEVLVDGKIIFSPEIDDIGSLYNCSGHLEIDVKGNSVLVNSQNNFNVGDSISIIVNKNDTSLIYFDKNNILT